MKKKSRTTKKRKIKRQEWQQTEGGRSVVEVNGGEKDWLFVPQLAGSRTISVAIPFTNIGLLSKKKIFISHQSVSLNKILVLGSNPQQQVTLFHPAIDDDIMQDERHSFFSSENE